MNHGNETNFDGFGCYGQYGYDGANRNIPNAMHMAGNHHPNVHHQNTVHHQPQPNQTHMQQHSHAMHQQSQAHGHVQMPVQNMNFGQEGNLLPHQSMHPVNPTANAHHPMTNMENSNSSSEFNFLSNLANEFSTPEYYQLS